MAGLQDIIDRCTSIQIDRRKVVGIQTTLNEIPRTSLTPTKQPWRITVEMPKSYRYNQARALMEALDVLDRYTPEIITFSNNTNLQWIFAYQGTMSPANIADITVDSFIGNQLVLSTLPAITSTRVLFEPNDLIQIGAFPYPFTVTQQVLRGSGLTVTLTMNRPNILTSPVAGETITVGNACEFNMFCPNMPTYKMTPGGFQRYNNQLTGAIINNAYLEFSSPFSLYEYVGGA